MGQPSISTVGQACRCRLKDSRDGLALKRSTGLPEVLGVAVSTRDWLAMVWNSGFRGSCTSSASTSCVEAYTQIQSSALAIGTRQKALAHFCLAHFSLAHFSAGPKCKMGTGIVMKTEGSKDAVSVTGKEGTWNKGERVPIPGSPPVLQWVPT